MTTTGIVRMTARYLNDVNDALPGQSVSGGQTYQGQLGAYMILNASDALRISDTAVGTLYEGVYQYVQLYVTLTQAPLVGAPVYWRDPDNFVVTTDHLTGNGSFAGVLVSVPTAGNYAWIQVNGKATLLTIGTVSQGSPAAGDPVSIKAATDGGFDDPTSVTAPGKPALIVGEWITAPTASTPTLYLAWLYGKNPDGRP